MLLSTSARSDSGKIGLSGPFNRATEASPLIATTRILPGRATHAAVRRVHVENVEAAVCKYHFFAGALEPANFLGDGLEGRNHMILHHNADREPRMASEIVGRNKSCCATQSVALIFSYMPVGTMQKVEALGRTFVRQRNSRISWRQPVAGDAWMRGAGIDPLNAEKVDLLDLVWSNLLRLYEREAALKWLFGVNPSLGDRRPIDLIRAGRTEELMQAIRAERSDAFA